jgi:hypothetical protein
LEELEISMESEVDINFAECFIKIPVEEATEMLEKKIADLK